MREDFKIEELNMIGIVKVCTDFYHTPNNRLFVKSPVTSDKNWSMKLYPQSNSFCDFANGNKGGDIIRLVSYVQNIDNWQALRLLKEYYGLSGEPDRENIKERIRQQEKEQEAAKRAEAERRERWRNEVDFWKKVSKACDEVIKRSEPLSDEWCFAVDEKQLAAHRLDCFCGLS